jgi:hypothetical protein
VSHKNETIQPLSHKGTKAQRHKGNENMSILHSYLKEKIAIQEKSRIIILYNLGALVPWWNDT